VDVWCCLRERVGKGNARSGKEDERGSARRWVKRIKNPTRRGGYSFYTVGAVVSKVGSLTVRFELKTISSFGAFGEPAVSGLCSLGATLKLLTHGGLALPNPITAALFRSWRRMIIMQKEIPRTGLVCAVGMMN